MQQRMKQGTEKMENDLIGSSWVHVSSLEPISCVRAVGHVVQMFYLGFLLCGERVTFIDEGLN